MYYVIRRFLSVVLKQVFHALDHFRDTPLYPPLIVILHAQKEQLLRVLGPVSRGTTAIAFSDSLPFLEAAFSPFCAPFFRLFISPRCRSVIFFYRYAPPAAQRPWPGPLETRRKTRDQATLKAMEGCLCLSAGISLVLALRWASASCLPARTASNHFFLTVKWCTQKNDLKPFRASRQSQPSEPELPFAWQYFRLFLYHQEAWMSAVASWHNASQQLIIETIFSLILGLLT